jgi:hypothetical protein
MGFYITLNVVITIFLKSLNKNRKSQYSIY